MTDACFAALRRAGWSIGDAQVFTPGRRFWLVTGTNGENTIRAEGTTQAEAWQRAVEQAQACGMLGRRELAHGLDSPRY